ncbi:MAG: YhdP family protein [Haliea sp.]|uniref:YhdP family protein n=1 Tax=Haliea sp. TaxID=1932666 RepID=UPI0032EE8297
MTVSAYQRLSSVLWGGIVGFVVLLAVFVSSGRLLVSMVGENQDWLVAQVNARAPFAIEEGKLSAEWRGFSPVLVFQGLRLGFSDGEPLLLGGGRVTLDVWQSMISRSLRFSRLRLEDLLLTGELAADGRFQLQGIGGGGGTAAAWLQALLLDIERVVLVANSLQLQLPNGEQEILALDLSLLRDGSRRQLRAELASVDGSQLLILADGVGNPLAPDDYTGDVYARANLVDLKQLSRWQPLLGQALPLRATGGAVVEGWLAWAGGISGLQLRLAGAKLLLESDSDAWSLPLDSLRLESSLQRRGQRLTLFTSDVEIGYEGEAFALPRLQLDLWGDSLRVRGSGLPLADSSDLLRGARLLPPALAEAMTELAPSGSLGGLQLYLEDVTSSSRGWSLELGFEELALQSWRGAPGVSGARGFLHLEPGAGELILDSDDVVLDFPTVYREPLAYRELFGTLDMGWDADGLRLHSGLLTAVGEEGMARALLGLHVPFAASTAGVEMDLLVGLRDTDAGYRARYLPYLLNENLLAWLQSSLEQGLVDAGAFLWRGSLRPGAAPLRTVQLFFEVRDGQLAYHPDWPVLTDVQGTVLIDDTNVSVWADKARLYDTDIKALSAEAWRHADGGMRLAIAASLAGGAGDGLQVLNQSPAGTSLRGALTEWQARGNMDADIRLQLQLAKEPPPPVVDLKIAVSDGALEIQPGNLQLEDISGILSYNSASGFRAEQMTASLWERPLDLALRQLPATGKQAGDSAGGMAPVQLTFASAVQVDDLRQWLGPVLPPLVSGAASFNGSLDFAPGSLPRLQLNSDLLGLALDLPATWAKPAGSALPFSLQAELGARPLRLELTGGRRWHAQLSIGDGRLQSAALGLQDRSLPLLPGRLRVSGHAALLDVAAWQSLLASLSGQSAEVQATRDLRLTVEDLLVDSLQLRGQDWQRVLLDLEQEPDQWRVSLETDWVQGAATVAGDLATARVDLAHLDLSGLGGGGGGEAEPGQFRDWPAIDVHIADLHRGARPLGELSLTLEPGPDRLDVRRIHGELLGFRLPEETPGSLLWTGEGTRLQAELFAADLGDTLAALDYERILETSSGRFGLDLRWPGAPQKFALAASSGMLSVAVEEGRFLTASAGASGTLRVVSILNLADIIQRLSLSQLFESGIPFDSMQGDVNFAMGQIEVPRLEVAGAATGFRFSGSSDIAARSLNGELVATLPVASNLPWVAALTAGLPVAAGVFVVSKLFEKQVSQLSSAVYGITGTWDDPQIRLDRIFDTGGSRVGQEEGDSGETAPEAGAPAQSSGAESSSDSAADSSSSLR